MKFDTARGVAFALMVILWNAGCISSKRIQDYTLAQASICAVHDLPMKKKLVPQTDGMKQSEWILKFRFVRMDIFPHADEVYDTYACLPSYERYARIHVCRECTTARTEWLADHSPPAPEDREYIRRCDALSKQFGRSYYGR